MKKKMDSSRREKSAAVGLVVCFVAMIAIVGIITFSQYQNKTEQKQQLAEVEKDDFTEDKEENRKEPSQTANTDSIQAELPDLPVEPTVETQITPAAPSLSFAANDVLQWPVDGNVILSYSMDAPIYFATLDQYKYNPALVISGVVGGEVIAAAKGEVVSVETNAQTGTTVTMNIGSGYKLVYGQLKEVCVKQGDYVSEGDLLGHVSEPTKYYSIEGPNVYFQLLKDGEPVNPLEYLDV